MVDDKLLTATLAAILSLALASNALLLHGEQRKSRRRRREWLVRGARNLALTSDTERISERQSGYSIEEPVGWADLGELLPAAAIYTCVTAIIAYAVVWSGTTAASLTPPAGTNASATVAVFVGHLSEILLYAFVPAYLSANMLIFLAADRGALETSSFVQATATQFLTVIIALVLLLLTIAFAQPFHHSLLTDSGLVPVKLWNVMIGLAPAFWVVANARGAALNLRRIQGLEYRDRLLLSGYGVRSVQNLATTNPGSLYVCSRFDIYRLADWMGQAQLLLQFPEDSNQLRRLGIRTIFDLVVLLESPARSRVFERLGSLGTYTASAAARSTYGSDGYGGDDPLPDLTRILEDPSFRALKYFRRIADSALAASMESMPAVLSSVLEKSVTNAVTSAMFGEPPVWYRGNVRLDVTLTREQTLAADALYKASVFFAPPSPVGLGWTALDIWEGRHEPTVPFRVRFDSDADDFESVETSVNVPIDREAEASSFITLPRSGGALVWATIIQSDRTVQVLQAEVLALAGRTD